MALAHGFLCASGVWLVQAQCMLHNVSTTTARTVEIFVTVVPKLANLTEVGEVFDLAWALNHTDLIHQSVAEALDVSIVDVRIQILVPHVQTETPTRSFDFRLLVDAGFRRGTARCDRAFGLSALPLRWHQHLRRASTHRECQRVSRHRHIRPHRNGVY